MSNEIIRMLHVKNTLCSGQNEFSYNSTADVIYPIQNETTEILGFLSTVGTSPKSLET